ncbi:PaaI family thioesterase [Alicyclobacillus mengziensis]|uniref:PaaI family thioesterase n=1 Tax=Alicyclobacillus mengziensis TaxID=2931921 RepID=A0A9X7Z765_9BACL|nr:PaaI family thioesterase [Alicyclobacillus mengziensis]QSO48062.1 PaaI family thioesterase [Alicyclobacillus mengziensis]
MLDEIVRELNGLPAEELAQILRLIRAKKATYHHPLAFVQEVMRFQAVPASEDGKYSYTMTISDELLNRYGILHGGLMTAFIDTAMAETAFVIDSTVERAFTLNISVDFIKPGKSGDLRADIKVIQNSRVIIVFHADVYDRDNQVVATAMAHFYKQHRRE